AVFISIAFAHPLLAWNQQNTYMKIIAGGAITNVLFNVLLIPKFGIVGASVSTVLAEVAVFSAAYFQIRKIVPISVFGYLTKPLFASILMLGIVSVSQVYIKNLFLLMPLAVCSYFLALLGINGISTADLKKLYRSG
ncbi:MAG: polysaccharide biosynthesis C-terminal domain-containing protein, partial [Candidatus Poribacteria bacterium]|nr:polysaccharide biosynthesis C-terminal domain-containing protein [Candidatus Poribacteria bacterium]